MSVPEIRVQDLSEMLNSDQEFVLLDVREPWEVARAKWDDERLRYLPLSQLAQYGLQSPKEELPIVVVCHHGIRSYQVTQWLLTQGWKDVVSLRGGIEAYALQIDPGVGRY